MVMQHKRQAPGRDIHRHFSLAPARGHIMTASNKASASSKASATTHSEQTQTVKGRRGGGQRYAVHAHAAPPSPLACAPPQQSEQHRERVGRQTAAGGRHAGDSVGTMSRRAPRRQRATPAKRHCPAPPLPPSEHMIRAVWRRGDVRRTSHQPRQHTRPESSASGWGAQQHLKQRAGTDGEGRRSRGQQYAGLYVHTLPPSARLCTAAVRRSRSRDAQ